MENNKYYTPDITEFRVGFECVWNDCDEDDNWRAYVIDDAGALYHIIEDIRNPTHLRYKAKYLDAQDIEELGWKVNVITHDYGYVLKYDKPYKDDFAHFIIDRDKPKYYIITIPEKDIDGDFIRVTVFKGTILNKSELQWILTKVGAL